jgi:hypothetical protein
MGDINDLLEQVVSKVGLDKRSAAARERDLSARIDLLKKEIGATNSLRAKTENGIKRLKLALTPRLGKAGVERFFKEAGLESGRR